MLTQAMSRTYVAGLLESKEHLKVGAGPHLCKAGLSRTWLCDEVRSELWERKIEKYDTSWWRTL